MKMFKTFEVEIPDSDIPGKISAIIADIRAVYPEVVVTHRDVDCFQIELGRFKSRGIAARFTLNCAASKDEGNHGGCEIKKGQTYMVAPIGPDDAMRGPYFSTLWQRERTPKWRIVENSKDVAAFLADLVETTLDDMEQKIKDDREQMADFRKLFGV